MTLRTTTRAIVEIFRPELTVAAGICAVTGEVLALGAIPSAIDLLLGFTIIFLIAAFDMIENDIYDLEVDKVNAPQRPLPSGRLSVKSAYILGAICVIGSVVLSAVISWLVLGIAVFLLVVGHIYNWKGKDDGLLGNMMVSLSVGTGFITGAAIMDKTFEPLVWAFATMGFFVNLALELVGDAMDYEGDIIRGSRSLAITKGQETALRVSLAMLFLFAMASMIPYVFGSMGIEYLMIIVPLDMLVLYLGLKFQWDMDAMRTRLRVKKIYVSLTVAMMLIIALRVYIGVDTMIV
jgi:geranylgeranylglycerol-phosphate geranylgeranyltransferase